MTDTRPKILYLSKYQKSMDSIIWEILTKCGPLTWSKDTCYTIKCWYRLSHMVYGHHMYTYYGVPYTVMAFGKFWMLSLRINRYVITDLSIKWYEKWTSTKMQKIPRMMKLRQTEIKHLALKTSVHGWLIY